MIVEWISASPHWNDLSSLIGQRDWSIAPSSGSTSESCTYGALQGLIGETWTLKMAETGRWSEWVKSLNES